MATVNYEPVIVWKRCPASPPSCPRNRRRLHYARIKTNPAAAAFLDSVGGAGEGTTLWGCI